MKTISPELVPQYKALLNQNGISDIHHNHYLKWLRFYLDFCDKYKFRYCLKPDYPRIPEWHKAQIN